jgi:hypothetical protein
MDTAMTRGNRNKQGGGHDAMWNTSAPILQESADSMVDGVGYQQLSAMAMNSLPVGESATAFESAQGLTAYRTTPETMREGQRRRLEGHDGKTRIPGWVWGIGGITLALFLSRR